MKKKLEVDCYGICKSVRYIDREDRERGFKAICPAYYQRFNIEHCKSPQHYEAVMRVPVSQWNDDDDGTENHAFRPGLLLHGDTGRGKTFAAWQWIRKRLAEDISMFWTDGAGWKLACWKNSGKAELREEFMDPLCASDDYEDSFGIVFIDDLDKDKLTGSAVKMLNLLLERRTSQLMPTVITTQLSGSQLYNKIVADMKDSGDDGAEDPEGRTAIVRSIMRRLGDPFVFHSVDFGKPAAPSR